MEYTEAELDAFGQRLGRKLVGGDVIELIGDVGAGKTTLTKAIARGLGVTEDVQSPTFTISQTYEGSDGRKLAHYDFYRLNDPGIMRDEISETSRDSSTITVIEWGESIRNVLPDSHYTIHFTPVDESVRKLKVEPADAPLFASKNGGNA